MENLYTTKDKVLKTAKEHPEAKPALEGLYPEAFGVEPFRSNNENMISYVKFDNDGSYRVKENEAVICMIKDGMLYLGQDKMRLNNVGIKTGKGGRILIHPDSQ